MSGGGNDSSEETHIKLGEALLVQVVIEEVVNNVVRADVSIGPWPDAVVARHPCGAVEDEGGVGARAGFDVLLVEETAHCQRY